MSDDPTDSNPAGTTDSDDGGDASESRGVDDERPEGADASEAAPLADLAQRVSDRHDARADEQGPASGPDLGDDEPTAAADEDPFEEVSVGDIDEEELWASLEEPAEPTAAVGAEASARTVTPETDPSADTTEHVVDKTEYCQRCPHLDDPPELACTHEGTEIVEVTDSDHFRVRNCPIVEE